LNGLAVRPTAIRVIPERKPNEELTHHITT